MNEEKHRVESAYDHDVARVIRLNSLRAFYKPIVHVVSNRANANHAFATDSRIRTNSRVFGFVSLLPEVYLRNI
jgi:hypothetical protein